MSNSGGTKVILPGIGLLTAQIKERDSEISALSAKLAEARELLKECLANADFDYDGISARIDAFLAEEDKP